MKHSSHKRLERCSGKGTYRSRNVAEKYRQKSLHDMPGIYLRVYKCPRCKHWHLTSKKPRTYVRKEAEA